MSKQEFLSRLRQALSGLPEDDVAERIAFYSESIDDRMIMASKATFDPSE